ncbi:hypothetical protein WICPIJ_004426 [Wickerhamomyces pijperi]|uniref:CREG-like beta-barrel domain-containing protein n=1 Tax=Wickerhamomyces pijperi TaxID=599730 RepID=A0A9P8Q7Z0_WICPI|nr:hypothetical protein WICPIJ_004426 [Wickerhamomyces pijperi]
MNFLSLLTSILTLTILSTPPGAEAKPPTVEDAARYARTLVKRESLANVNTINNDTGIPVSFVEYYADCGDGSPVMLIIDMSSSHRNIKKGSPVSLSIRVGDHPAGEEVDPKYPGSRPGSVAGSPRISLRGHLQTINKDENLREYLKMERCFLQRHRDASWWLPHNPIHSSHFAKFDIEGIYFIGGFGDTGYIGEIPVEMYNNAKDIDSEETEVQEQQHPFGVYGDFTEQLDTQIAILERIIANDQSLMAEDLKKVNINGHHSTVYETSAVLSKLNELKKQALDHAFDLALANSNLDENKASTNLF